MRHRSSWLIALALGLILCRSAAIRGDSGEQEPSSKDKQETPKRQEAKAEAAVNPKRFPEEHRARINDLIREMIQLTRQGHLEKALAAALEAHRHAEALKEVDQRRGPSALSLTHYNLACMYSRLGRKDEAFRDLARCAEIGRFPGDLVLQMESDPDLDNIRKDSRYAAVLDRAKGRWLSPTDEPASKEQDAGDDRDGVATVPEMEQLAPRARIAKINDLTQLMMRASDAGDREASLELALAAHRHAQVLSQQVGQPVQRYLSMTSYNLARSYSLLGDKKLAFEYLNNAIRLGGFGRDLFELMKRDADLDPIRDDYRFRSSLAWAKRLMQRLRTRRQTPTERVTDSQWQVTLPAEYDSSRKTPLIVALHHYNSNMERAKERWREAAAAVGAILLTPQGTLSTGLGTFSWGAELDLIEDNVLDAIGEVSKEYNVDRGKVILVGFSQGARATWGIAMRNPETFLGVIPIAGRFQMESDLDLEEGALAKLRIFMMSGSEINPRILQSNEQARRRFERLGAAVRLSVYEGIGHDFPDDATAEQVNALRFILAG